MDFEKINPLYLFDGNALVTSLGDVSVCYRYIYQKSIRFP